MRTILLAAGCALAALSSAGSAQGEASAAAPTCYIEIQRLMGEPPAGIGELGAAIRALDAKLRPQVEEINALKQQIARIENRQEQTLPVSVDAALADDDEAPAPGARVSDGADEALQKVRAELEAKQTQLRADYRAQQQAIIGPVQVKVSEKAQAFASGSGCAQVKMARASDLEALRTAAARDVTGEFVAWYLGNPPA